MPKGLSLELEAVGAGAHALGAFSAYCNGRRWEAVSAGSGAKAKAEAEAEAEATQKVASGATAVLKLEGRIVVLYLSLYH